MINFWSCFRRFALEFALLTSILVLSVQLAWPAISDWLIRPIPGKLGIVNLADLQSSSLASHCLVYLPQLYDSETKYPLLLSLHGAGSRGNDIGLVRASSLAEHLVAGGSYPCIIIAPQCRPEHQWNAKDLSKLIDFSINRFAVDERRIYILGYSMGAYGAWEMARRDHKKLAAVITLCGGGKLLPEEQYDGPPIWAFHGSDDNVIPLWVSQEMIQSVLAAGGNAKLTILPGRGHDITEVAYKNPELTNWILQQKRPLH